MWNDVIFWGSIVAVLTIIWIALNINIRIRKQKVDQIKSINLKNYVTFINSYKLAEEEEQKGNVKVALVHYRKALESLEREENPDALIEETTADLRTRIQSLETE